ncbi:MAG TPA: hypothetical protein K8V32_01750 [Enteractinococcus helveticum]|uniref:Uncharacterized protein n=1 Tax=Enteractinococcus helveticum TaxID=1837282 RepID=A0A921FMJ9_9MICC|nr:hypothetical protein [Enteractinococcus helveticum]HJF13511.1 hypothetical protein [Enteractinococcus helveticum]
MNSSASASTIAERLLAGPRGRRFLLEYALASELAQNPVRSEESFGSAAFDAAYRLDPAVISGSARKYQSLFGEVTEQPDMPVVTPAEAAERLDMVELLEPTPKTLRSALAVAVDTARYWQEPDGDDVLAATPDMLHGLRRVAEHIAASPLPGWWWTPVDRFTQHCVLWEGAAPVTIPDDVHATLLAASDQQRAEERLALQERDQAPTANWSGEWWSHPPVTMPSSTRKLFDGSPAGLWFVEDSFGWEDAESMRVFVPQDISVFEIEDASDWAKLCARFPMDVTAQKRHDWYRTTGRIGRWITPGWVQVAEHYDAVHLQVGAYLSAAGIAIPVDDITDSASVIAGWDPDTTYWFSSSIAYDYERIGWLLVEAGVDMVWKPVPAQETHT